MSQGNFLFTSESVSEGHPDKISDQISDAVLDAALKKDPMSRVACETLVTTGLVVVSGEITTKAYIEIPKIVRETIRDIGYTHSEMGFDYETCGVMVTLDEQSQDIAQGVDDDKREQGAGDQGMMFGYASNETKELMPAPIMYAHKLVHKLAAVRKKGLLPYLRPDSKSQVSVRYEKGKPVCIETVVISSQHDDQVSIKKLRSEIIESVIHKVIPKSFQHKKNENPYQPHRSICYRRTSRGLWIDGKKNHCRYLWRVLTAWRRRFFRKGLFQSGPLCRLHGPLHCQKPGGRKNRRPL